MAQRTRPRNAPSGARRRNAVGVDLTRFRGHLTHLGGGGVYDAEDPTAVSPTVPGAAHRAGRTGRTPEELGRQFEPSAQTIRNWLRQADRDDGRRTDGLTTEEREEVRRLRREVKTLREEREILKKGSPGESVGEGMTHPVLSSGKMAVGADHQARGGERDAVED